MRGSHHTHTVIRFAPVLADRAVDFSEKRETDVVVPLEI